MEDPYTPPTVRCLTDIYHPNIERYSSTGSTNVCLNLFSDGEWDGDFGLQDVIQGLLFLLHNPEPEDPLLTGFDAANFEENVAKQKAGLEIDGCVVGEHEIEKNLPGKVESTDNMAVKVEGLLEKLELEAACGDKDDVTNDVTAGACATDAINSESTAAANEVNNDSSKCMEHEDGAAGTSVNPDPDNEVTTSDVTTTADNDVAFASEATVSAGTEEPSPDANKDATIDMTDALEETGDDQTSTDSGVICDTRDTGAIVNNMDESLNDESLNDESLNDPNRGLLTRAYRRSQSLPNDYEKEWKGKPVFCSCQSYEYGKDINDNNIALLNAIELTVDTDADENSSKTDLNNRASQQLINGTGYYQPQLSSECQAIAESNPKPKWWTLCFPWLAK